MVYGLALVAALIVATGEVVQQRTAALAPPEDNLSPRLLLWLVQRPRWLAGVGCSFAGNIAFATALHLGSVILVESVFVVRLVFGLAIAAFWRRHRVPARDLWGGLAITAGLITFLLAGHPHAGSGHVTNLRWAIGAGSVVFVALVLALAARTVFGTSDRGAALLGAGAGLLFGLQASLISAAVRVMTTRGIIALLTGWHAYVVVVVALLGMLLVQSAFEAAPLPSSYPAVITAQLLSAIVIGVAILGGTVRLSPGGIAAVVVALAVMVVGIVVLSSSHILTGHHPATERRARTPHRPEQGEG
ncbi:MAG TPA: DMT family transporter [Nocardioidaceae bacterium]|nr:DMT family transporter [Nocardioidaceae bacterium]